MKSPADSVEQWKHGLHVEENQRPLTEEEKERVSLLTSLNGGQPLHNRRLLKSQLNYH